MSMDFFAHQDRARASTRRLVVVYTLCLLGVIISLNVVAGMIWGVTQGAAAGRENERDQRAAQVSRSVRSIGALPVFATTTISVLTLVSLATMFKKMQLGGDGAKVAELLGGRPIVAAPSDPQERKLMNVVEEMSLASGVPMPRVYLMENEQGINAFAAGTKPEAAVIGVTRGCIERLSRDELQGVIAHEFSHILNGDMRLNLRLMALNFGLMAIGYIGLQILRFSPRSSSRNDKNGGAAGIMIFAVAMMIIGYIGTLFGKILQAAVSRQREYLADASAVQFTRNPGGIANALKKIGGFSGGAEIKSVHAGEMSHMFFADGVVGFLDSLFATHPPLDKRIKAIDPQFDGKIARTTSAAASPFPAAMSGFAAPPPLPSAGQRVVAPHDEIMAETGNIEPAKLVHAGATMAAIPHEIEVAAADPYSARAVAVALLLDQTPDVRARQLQSVYAEDEHVAAIAEQIHPHIAALGPSARLPILDLALPALHHLSKSQLKAFRNLCDVLAKADRRISSFEIALSKIVDHQLLSPGPVDGIALYRSVNAVSEPLRIVLSVLAHTGGQQQAQRAYDSAMARVGIKPGPMASPEESRQFERALSDLRHASPPVQKRVLDACAFCVAADGTVGIEEMELMRAISATLSIPMPPFLNVA
jgi:Zn-dependent protease with chaperone function